MMSYFSCQQCLVSALLGACVIMMTGVNRVTAAPSGRTHYIEIIRPALPLDTGPQEEYPVENQQQTSMAAPRKRAAIALDKLMYALKKALDSSGGPQEPQRPHSANFRTPHANRNYVSSGVDRRGQPDGRLYWRCYFNAVSCF